MNYYPFVNYANSIYNRVSKCPPAISALSNLLIQLIKVKRITDAFDLQAQS